MQHKYLDFARELKNLWNMKVTVMPLVSGTLGGTRTGGHGNKRISGDYPNYCIDEIGQNTKKNSGDLLSLRLW